MEELPLRKNPQLNDRLTLALDRELKTSILELKQKGLDHQEWIRMILRREVPKAKAKLAG